MRLLPLKLQKVSLFLDEIGNSTPNTVLLKQVIYQPLIKSIKRDKVIQYQSYQILIVGKSTNGDVFSEVDYLFRTRKMD